MSTLLSKLKALDECGVTISVRILGRSEAIDISDLAADAIGEIKDLTARAEEAEEKIDSLESRIEELETEAAK